MASNGQVIPPSKEMESEEGQEVLASSLSLLEESALNHQVAIAHRFPRSRTKFLAELTQIAQMSPAVAMEMMYSVPRGGKQLIGPSVRFAEALLSCWGNATATVEIVDTDKEWITAEGRFYDAEANVRIAVRVRRRITDRDNRRFNLDMIGVTGAAASSIALRGAILRGIPKALWADRFEMAKRTAAGEVKSFEKLIEDSMKYFVANGITEVRVLNTLNVVGRADIGTEEVLLMATWQKQLRAGESAVEDIFGSPVDDEIERTMTALKWNETQKRMSRSNFAGRRDEHLAYVRDQAQKAGINTDAAAEAKPAPAPAKAATQEAPAAEAQKEAAAPAQAAAPATETQATAKPAAAAAVDW